MKGWEDAKAQEMLRKQRFLGIFLNIVFTFFYEIIKAVSLL